MSEESRLLHALKDSGIVRIAVLDDAFDVPVISEDNLGPVKAHFLTNDFIDAIAGDENLKDLRQPALDAINNGEAESDVLAQFLKLLFKKYIDDAQPAFDPGNEFSRARKDNLDSVRPILELLRRANPSVEVKRIGSMEEDGFAGLIADIDLIFADFFLDPAITPADQPDDPVSQEAMIKSRSMVQKIIEARGKVPSIVLMSSKDVAGRASIFRKGLVGDHGQVAAARFQFVEKGDLSVVEDRIEIKERASDTLLDILQSYKFGEGLSAALKLWAASANGAISATTVAISDLEIRDFAYLIRFRLEKEGQELVEYMEWLLGEYLIDETARQFYVGVSSDPTVRSVADNEKFVEGAYDGQSLTVANIYHRVRIEDVRAGRAASIRMGDLYLESDNQRISAVITPDCDLVVRDGKRRAKRLTVVNGRIVPFDRKNTSAEEFIMIDNAAKNIAWAKKDIETHEFGWETKEDERRALGTLRPMYAQQLQRAVVHDFGRVGLAPWPALYVTADVELWYLDKDCLRKRLTLPAHAAKTCTVMPKRPGAPLTEKHIAIFTRSFMREVRKALAALDPLTVVASGRAYVTALEDVEVDIALAQACRGVPLETTLAQNIMVTQIDNPSAGGWCWLVVRVT